MISAGCNAWLAMTKGLCIVLLAALAAPALAEPPQGDWVNRAGDGRLLYLRDPLGQRLPDFGRCGYEDFEGRRVDPARRRRSLRLARRLADEMIEVAVPVVAAVNGPAVGLGCTVATLCDIVFMADTAWMADTHVSVALVAGDGGAVTWPAHTSLLRAKQYLLTGDRLGAEEAVGIGLANFVVPAERLLDEALAFAHRLADQPPQAVQETKAVLNQHLRANAVRALGYGLATESGSHDTPEYAGWSERLRPED